MSELDRLIRSTNRPLRRGIPIGTESWQEKFSTFLNTTLIGKSLEDDAVSLAVKRICLLLTISISLWLISFVLVMTDIIARGFYVSPSMWLFAPMWLGSAVGIVASVSISLNVCSNATLVSRERRLFMRAQGTEASARFIDYESLPLMRRVFCWNLVLVLTFLMALITQVLYSLWFVYGYIGVWHALVPIIIVGIIYLAYIVVIRVCSLITCALSSILALQLILVALKCRGEIGGGALGWATATIPVMVVQLVTCVYLARTLARWLSKYYILQDSQVFCLFGYIISVLLSLWAQSDTVYEAYDSLLEPLQLSNRDSGLHSYNSTSLSELPALLWTISICLFIVSGLIVMNVEGREMAEKRGFSDPTPLSRTRAGWEPAERGCLHYNLLLGTIFAAQPSLVHISKHDLNSDRKISSIAKGSTIKSYQRGSTAPSNVNDDKVMAGSYQHLSSSFEIELPPVLVTTSQQSTQP